MAGGAEILVHASADEVVEALTARLLARLAEIQRDFRVPQVALTGGRIATRAYGNLAAEGANSAVDWSRVELWWGDERFVPAENSDRNAEPALKLLSGLGLSPDRVHPMPAADAGMDLDQAAEAYAAELGDTVFDICLLGLGPDGHVASLFPEHPSSYAEGHVIAVAPHRSRPPTGSASPCGDQPVARGVVPGQRFGQGGRGEDGLARSRARPGAGGRSCRCRAHAVADGRDAASELPQTCGSAA